MDTTTVTGLEEEDDLPTAPVRLGDAGDDAALMTTAQTQALLSDDEDRLANARRDLDHARTSYNNTVTQTTSDTARDALESEFGPVLDAAESTVASVADAISRNMFAVIEETQSAPPSLTADQLAQANALKAFVIEDVERLPLRELRSRVRHSLATGAIPEMYLLSRAVPIRIERERQQPGFAPESLGDLDRLAREAATRLPRDRSLAPLRDRAEKLLHGSQALRGDARRRQSERDAKHAMEIAFGGPGVPIPDAD